MIGRTISHYKILEKLGEGGMGVVYKAQDLTLDRFVAIKFLTHHLSRDEDATRRFIHEAKAASALDHTNIGTIYEVDKTPDEHTFIVMAYYEGETLRERIDRGELSREEALDIASQIASGLARAHEQGIVHRDIKPSNILLTRRNEVKIVDFGLAKLVGKTRITRKGGALGTATYMSPEQVRGEEVDERSDIFSMGTVLYELLTGQTPFQGEYEAAVLYEIDTKDPEPLSTHLGDIPDAIQIIVSRALKKERDGRYQQILDMRNDIDEFITRGSISLAEPGRRIFTVTRRLPAKSRIMVFAAIAALIVIGAISFIILRSNRHEDLALAVMDFRDLSNYDDLPYSASITSLVNVGLAENSPVRIISTSLLDDLRRRLFGSDSGPIKEGQALEIAQKSGASLALLGDVTKVGDDLLVMWQLINVGNGEMISAKRERSTDLVNCADRVIANVLPLLHKESGTIEQDSLLSVGELTTYSTEAYKHYIAGVFALRYADTGTAIRELERALQIDSSFALAYFDLGKSYFGYHGAEYDRDMARDYIERAWQLRVRLSYKDRLRLEAWRHSLNRRIPDALSVYEEILARWPDDRETLVGYAEELFYWWRFEDAASVAGRALESYPDDIDLGGVRCWAMSYTGHPEEALDAALAVASYNPEVQNAWDILGTAYLMVGLTDSAETAFRKVLAVDSNFVLSREGLAQAEYFRGNVSGAIARYRMLFEQPHITPPVRARMATTYNGWLDRTGILIEAGRLQEALQVIDDAARLVSGNAQLQAWLALGRCEVLLSMGRYEDVVELAKEVNGNPAFEINRGDSHWFRGRALAALGDSAGARRAVEALRGWEERTGIYKFRCYRLGISAELALIEYNPEAAIEYLAEMKRNGGFMNGLMEIGTRRALARAFVMEGAVDKAVKELKNLLSIYGGHALAHYELGKIYEGMNRPAQAKLEYQRFLEMWSEADKGLPQFEDAGTRLARLSEKTL